MNSQTSIITTLRATAVTKTSYPLLQFMVRAAMAGAFIALGGVLSVVSSAGFSDNVSLQKIVSGLTFPIGLVLTVVFGAELFTGNCAVLIPGATSGSVSAGSVGANWVKSWIGNFIGALLIVGLCVGGCGLFDYEPFASAITRISSSKMSLSWSVAFWRGVGCNWLVCLAVWLALTARTFPAKVIGCWLPVCAFVILGFEHCIANMFFIPAGMIVGNDYDLPGLFNNLLPVTLGNIAGGAIFVGSLNTWLFSEKKER